MGGLCQIKTNEDASLSARCPLSDSKKAFDIDPGNPDYKRLVFNLEEK